MLQRGPEIWGFPEIRDTFLGVAIIRVIIFWGLSFGSPEIGKLPEENNCWPEVLAERKRRPRVRQVQQLKDYETNADSVLHANVGYKDGLGIMGVIYLYRGI